jgi:hypothetical protein
MSAGPALLSVTGIKSFAWLPGTEPVTGIYIF